MYILKCSDGSYYTGNTKELEIRLAQHQVGIGANHKSKRLSVKFVHVKELMMHFIEKNRSKVGGEKRKKPLFLGNMIYFLS
jgi:putative endonuclease